MRIPRRRPRLPIRLLIVAGLIALAVRFLTSEPTLTYALDEAAARLHEELGLTLVVAHVNADPQTARVELGPVVLKGTDGQVLFAADLIRAEVAPLPLFERRIRLEHLEVVRPRVQLRIVDGTIAGILVPEDGGGDAALPRIDVADFRLHDGQVDITVESKNTVRTIAHLEGIEMRLRDRGREEHRLKFTVARADVKRPLPDGGEDIVIVDAFGGRLAVKGDGLLAPERVRVSEVTLAADDAEVTLAGDVILGPAGLVPAFDADVTARVNLQRALAHLQLPFPVRGNASLSAHVSGKAGAKDLAAEGQIDTQNVEVDNLKLGSLRARVAANEKRVDVHAASWDWADTTIQGAATVMLDEQFHTTVKANAGTFSIYQLMHNMDVPGAWGDARIDGQVAMSGTLNPLLLEGTGGGFFTDVRVASMDVRKAKPDDLVIAAPRPIEAQDVKLRVDHEGIRFDGTIDDGLTRGTGFFQIFYDVERGLLIDAETQQADFQSIGNKIADLGFEGVGRGHLHVEGPQSGPVLTAELEIAGFALEGFQFGDATGRVHLFRDDLSFLDVVAVKNGRSRYGGSVKLSFDDSDLGEGQQTPKLAVDIAFDPARAEDLRAVVPARYVDGVLGFLREDLEIEGPVKGRMTGAGPVGGGTFDFMQGEGHLELLEGATLLGQRLTGAGKFHMDLERFFIDGLDIKLANGTGYMKGSVGRENADLEGNFSLKGAQLAGIDPISDAPRPFSGSFDVEGTLLRHARDPGVKGRARLYKAAYGKIPIGDADVSLDHAGRVLTLQGTLLSNRGEGTIHVETRRPFTYDAALNVKQGPLRTLLPPDLLPDGVEITIAGDVDVRGALKTMRDSRGNLRLNTVAVNARGLELASKGDAAAHFHGTRLTFDLLDLTTADGDLISARGLVADDALDLQLSGSGKLSVLPKFWPRAEYADGRFGFDVALTGDLDHASMSGQGHVSSAKLKLDGWFPPLDDLDAQISFRGPNIVIEHADAKAEGARVQAQGAVTLDGTDVRFYDLELRTQRLKLNLPTWLETVTSGRLTLKGDSALPTLAGELRVHSARYSEDINWERLLPDLRRRSTALESLDSDDEDVRFDVHLIADRGIVVENNVLDLEAKGDLFLTGTEERPGLKGGVQLIRGNATFRGTRYRIARGTVDFVDTYRVMPILDVEAETRVHDYDVTAHLIGPAQAPTIDLSSRPELSEIDIISLLTFGFTQYEIRDASGSAGAAGLEVVSAYTGLDKELKRVLPEAVRKSNVLALDELRLTSQFSLKAGASVPAVAVGMEINPGLLVIDGSRLRLQSTLVDTTGSGTEQKVEWEKRFDSNVRLRLVWNSEDDGSCPSCTNQWGDLGGDVWYRWEF